MKRSVKKKNTEHSETRRKMTVFFFVSVIIKIIKNTEICPMHEKNVTQLRK